MRPNSLSKLHLRERKQFQSVSKIRPSRKRKSTSHRSQETSLSFMKTRSTLSWSQSKSKDCPRIYSVKQTLESPHKWRVSRWSIIRQMWWHFGKRIDIVNSKLNSMKKREKLSIDLGKKNGWGKTQTQLRIWSEMVIKVKMSPCHHPSHLNRLLRKTKLVLRNQWPQWGRGPCSLMVKLYRTLILKKTKSLRFWCNRKRSH